jgi:hypothetical protein
MAKKQKKEKLPACKVCGKTWRHADSDKFRYTNGILACRNHHGIEAWFNEEMEKQKRG